jgi:hypothetical protein
VPSSPTPISTEASARLLAAFLSYVRNQGRRATPRDPGLAAVEASWPELPAVIEAGILAMVKAALGYACGAGHL